MEFLPRSASVILQERRLLLETLACCLRSWYERWLGGHLLGVLTQSHWLSYLWWPENPLLPSLIHRGVQFFVLPPSLMGRGLCPIERGKKDKTGRFCLPIGQGTEWEVLSINWRCSWVHLYGEGLNFQVHINLLLTKGWCSLLWLVLRGQWSATVTKLEFPTHGTINCYEYPRLGSPTCTSLICSR